MNEGMVVYSYSSPNSIFAFFFFFLIMKKKAFENTVEKGEKAGNQYFLPFPQLFYTFFSNGDIVPRAVFNLLSANAYLYRKGLKMTWFNSFRYIYSF